jgi:hypothetical protein
MSSGTVEVAFGSGVDALFLTAGDTTLTLAPAGLHAATTTTIVGGPSAGPELAGTEWRVVGLYRGDEVVLGGPLGTTPLFTFDATTVAWHDRCNSSSGTWSVDAEGYLVITDTRTTPTGCPEVDERTQAWELIETVMGSDRIYMDEMGGQLELSDTEGNHITLEPA